MWDSLPGADEVPKENLVLKPKRVVAILDTMYHPRCRGRLAPRWFEISRDNYSGKRLYKLIGEDVDLKVTNSCSIMGDHANHHSKPSPEWLKENLDRLDEESIIRLILVCGKIAQKTYNECGFYDTPDMTIIDILHPAARTWSKKMIEKVQQDIANALL